MNKPSKNILFLFQIVGVALITLAVLALFASPKLTIKWQDYDPQIMAQAKADQKWVVMDFYADWCVPCLELDRVTYVDTDVQAALADFVKVKVDATNPDAPEIKTILERYDVPGLPAILFFDAKGEEVKTARITGFVFPDDFLKVLKQLPKRD